MTLKVAVNGYGVIGRRVADAVALQEDMELTGVGDLVTDWRARIAVKRGFPLFAASVEALEQMKAAGLEPRGTVGALLEESDVVVDCTPKGVDAKNRSRYEEVGIRAIFQGGGGARARGPQLRG
jgi:glyceraldehyde-3-phosphate dehydrogenase (NAD(P))